MSCCLADPRATALVKNFGGQWLFLRNMKAVDPDANAFPDFDDNLRDAFLRETELFLESQMREDRPLPELLTANYTFANERLAKIYEIPDVTGSDQTDCAGGSHRPDLHRRPVVAATRVAGPAR